MKILFALLTMLLFYQKSISQNNNASAKESDETLAQITKNVFKYSTFQPGKVVYKDSSENDVKLNYNRILGKIFYLDRMGKSVILENPETVSMIAIAADTFYFFDTNCVVKYTHFRGVNLYLKQTIVYTVKHDGEKNSLDPIVISNNSGLPYAREEVREDDSFDKNSMFKMINDYFVADTSLTYYPASKKNISDFFPSKKDRFKKYMQENNVNFNNAAAIAQVLQYMNSQ